MPFNFSGCPCGNPRPRGSKKKRATEDLWNLNVLN
jgi:hypothetical protein